MVIGSVSREITAESEKKSCSATHPNFRSCRVSKGLSNRTTLIEIAVYL